MVIDIVWFWRNKLCFPASLSVIVVLLPLGVESEALRLILVVDSDSYSNSPCWRWRVDFPFSNRKSRHEKGNKVLQKLGPWIFCSFQSSSALGPKLLLFSSMTIALMTHAKGQDPGVRSQCSRAWIAVFQPRYSQSGTLQEIQWLVQERQWKQEKRGSGWAINSRVTALSNACGSNQQHCPGWPPRRGPPRCYTAGGHDVTPTDLCQSPQSL